MANFGPRARTTSGHVGKATTKAERRLRSNEMRIPVLVAVALVLAGCSGTHKAPAPSPSTSTTNTTASPTPSPSSQAASAYSDWPTYHGDPARTGVSSAMPKAGRPHVRLVKLD